MEKGLYVIYDKVGTESSPILDFKNDAVAWRFFQQQRDSKTGGYPNDIELIKIANFDTETLELIPDQYDVEASIKLAEELDNEEQGI